MLDGIPGFTDFKGQLLPATNILRAPFSRKLTFRQIRPFFIFHLQRIAPPANSIGIIHVDKLFQVRITKQTRTEGSYGGRGNLYIFLPI